VVPWDVRRAPSCIAIAVALASCRSIDSSPAGPLAVELDDEARHDLCQMHTVFANYGCASPDCMVWERQATCEQLLAQLPPSCTATVDDVVACIHATCAQPCTTVCGIALWAGPSACP